MAIVNISKNYSRKLSLKEIIGRYDNIECGTMISLPVNVNDEEGMNKALRVLGKKVLRDTERDLAETLASLKETAADSSNSALVAEGTAVSKTSRESSNIDGMDDILKQSGIVEVELDNE